MDTRNMNILKDIWNDLCIGYRENRQAIREARLPVSLPIFILICGLSLIPIVLGAYLIQPVEVEYKSYSNEYISFTYPMDWQVIRLVDQPGVKLVKGHSTVTVQVLTEQDYVIHQQNLLNARFSDRGSTEYNGVVVGEYMNSYLSTGQDVRYYYFNKNGRYYEIRSDDTYECANLVENLIVVIK